MSISRAGQLNCVCPPLEASEAAAVAKPVLAIGFGLSVLAQSLALAGLPVAATTLAPNPFWTGVPYAAWLIGALIATFPASILSGLFGRRAAFALGASLGLAGGGLAGWGFYAGQFPALILGAFWLGLAQGFGLFYRHMAGAEQGSALRLLFGAGAIAILSAPLVTQALRLISEIFLVSFLLGAAGFFSFVALGASLLLPPMSLAHEDETREPASSSGIVGVTLAAFFAWGVMAALMGATPGLLQYCGLGLDGASGLVAWHMLAMYVPASLIAPYAVRLGVSRVIITGLVSLVVALAMVIFWHAFAPIAVALSLAGFGWSLVTLGATLQMQERAVSRVSLAFHDATLFLGSILGALARPML